GATNACSRRLIFAAAGGIPGQAHDVLRAGARFLQKLDDALQRGADLRAKIRRIVALLVAAGLTREHDPSAGSVDLDAVRESPRFRPFGRLQDTHTVASLSPPS